MTGRVRREGSWARKAVGARHGGLGPELTRRSEFLRATGVRLPVVEYDEAAGEIIYPWISGTSGAEHLRARLARSSGRNWEAEIGAACAGLLRPLVRLHAADPHGLDLPALDPWRRVRPRIEILAPSAVEPEGNTVQAEILRSFEVLEDAIGSEIESFGALNRVPVHGDYHVGQILFEPGCGEAWLLDLDDLALGPLESDLGNFAAHLATSDHVVSTPPLAAFAILAGLVIQCYAELAGRTPELHGVEAFGAVALLRRGLKLWKRAPADDRIGPILTAARAVARQARGPG